MCHLLKVSRSGYYNFKNESKSEASVSNENLLIEINRVYLEHKSNYGSPRIWNQLRKKEHIVCSKNRVARLMTINGIFVVHKRKFRMTINSKHDYPVWPNVLKRNFVVDERILLWYRI
jgi:putative transposase